MTFNLLIQICKQKEEKKARSSSAKFFQIEKPIYFQDEGLGKVKIGFLLVFGGAENDGSEQK
jgi:hypothetical protein